MRICFATNNAHKIEEVRSILGDRFPLVSLAEIGCHEELPETQDTISANSHQKADYVFSHYGIATLADDSGLEVPALGGEPGVNSAHYAGPQRNASDNMNLLLKNMSGIADRNARFKTILTLVVASGNVHQFEGVLEGAILMEKRGASGFGYDPLFLPHASLLTLAEMTSEEKNKISHRAKAVQKLVEFLN